MLLDDPECLRHLRTPHASDLSNGLIYPGRRQRDHDFRVPFPYVHVRRFMFARRKIDDNAKAADTKNGGHRITLTYLLGSCNVPSTVRVCAFDVASERFTQEDSGAQPVRVSGRGDALDAGGTAISGAFAAVSAKITERWLAGQDGNINKHFDKVGTPGQPGGNDPSTRTKWNRDFEKGIREMQQRLEKLKAEDHDR